MQDGQSFTDRTTALESLVSTLRSHLPRLTAGIAVHRTSIDDLQALRDSDLKSLKMKMKIVDQLRRRSRKIDERCVRFAGSCRRKSKKAE